jgi:hypothetical protein
MGNCGTVWESVGSYAKLWDRVGKYGTVWESVGPSGTVWESAGPGGTKAVIASLHDVIISKVPDLIFNSIPAIRARHQREMWTQDLSRDVVHTRHEASPLDRRIDGLYRYYSF